MNPPFKKNVLVIDDDEGVADIVGRLLEAANYSATIVTDADRALELAGALEPAAIVCDICMPHCSGFATVAALKQNPYTSSIPVILMSGYHQDNGMLKLASAFLPKPFHPEELLRVVREALQRRIAAMSPAAENIVTTTGESGLCFAC